MEMWPKKCLNTASIGAHDWCSGRHVLRPVNGRIFCHEICRKSADRTTIPEQLLFPSFSTSQMCMDILS